MTYKIYTLNDPATGAPFLVGRTTRPLPLRLSGHISGARLFKAGGRTEKGALIRDILARGERPEILLLEETTDPEREEWYINLFAKAGIPLTNRAF